MSSSRAFSFIATSSSGGIALRSTRCCHPADSVRFDSTVTKPLSSSITASLMVCCAFKWRMPWRRSALAWTAGLYAPAATGVLAKALRSQDFHRWKALICGKAAIPSLGRLLLDVLRGFSECSRPSCRPAPHFTLTRLLSRHRERPTAPGRSPFQDPLGDRAGRSQHQHEGAQGNSVDDEDL